MTSKQKGIIAIVAFVVVCIIGGAIIYGGAQYRKYQQAVGASKALTAEYEAYKAEAKKLQAGLTASINDLEKQRLAALEQAALANAKQADIQAQYDKLKGETAALPPDALSGAINVRIGADQSRPTANGLFSFSRVGTDRTLNLFLDGEAASLSLEASVVEAASLRSAVSLAAGIANDWAKRFEIQGVEYGKAIKAWDADRDALTHLRRSIFGRRVKSFITGAAAGVAAVLIYNAIHKEP